MCLLFRHNSHQNREPIMLKLCWHNLPGPIPLLENLLQGPMYPQFDPINNTHTEWPLSMQEWPLSMQECGIFISWNGTIHPSSVLWGEVPVGHVDKTAVLEIVINITHTTTTPPSYHPPSHPYSPPSHPYPPPSHRYPHPPPDAPPLCWPIPMLYHPLC